MVTNIKRYYPALIGDHFASNRQMLFLSGPRQVGKTTTSIEAADTMGESSYFNWDDLNAREKILAGPSSVVEEIGLARLRSTPPICIFDELHKYSGWKTFLKGMFDVYGHQFRIIVTGSARLTVFQAGGDSMMGRYFPYRLHPLTIGELIDPSIGKFPRPPKPISSKALDKLVRFGGFPEPFTRADQRFWKRWRMLRAQQFIQEDLRDLSRIQEIGQMEMLVELLRRQVGQLTSLSSLAKAVRVSVDTIRRWVAMLESLYYCFSIRPWHRNVARSLRKEPKFYLWDWSLVDDPGSRAENIIASTLLKTAHLLTDLGEADCELCFLRDKQKHEVDFIFIREGEPWFLVEVKKSEKRTISSGLDYFCKHINAPHAFQVAFDAPYVDADCFSEKGPIEVPAKTLLSQLV